MSKLDEIKPSGHDGLYKTEFQVEGQWISMALLSKRSIIEITDDIDKKCDRDVESINGVEIEQPYICCDMLERALGDHRGLYSQTIGKLGSDEIDSVIMYVGGEFKYSTGPAVVQYCPFCGKPRIRASEAKS